MALIRGRKLARDNWLLLEAASDGAAPEVPHEGDVIVPLAAWRAQREVLRERGGRLGVWLGGDDEPLELASDLDAFGVIAVRFSSFTDGRGYSVGRLLRQRCGWTGELRAIGDVQRDQLVYLARCGFDSFQLRSGEDPDVALAAFRDFSDAYQATVEQPLPLFRRREIAR